MQKIFEYKNGEIKLMLNEIVLTKDYVEDWSERKFRKTTNKISDPFSIGLELKVHRGGRICYGMLGACVKPFEEQDCINVSIAFTQNNTIKYLNSILLNDEYVYKGLPEEYVEAIYNSIYDGINEKEDYPQSDISFAYAANCEVGSSSALFGIIAKIILEIICTSSIYEIMDMDIASFTEKYVKNINLRY